MSNGENPLRWDCEKQGCFNKKKRPKIEVFAECFPRRINFGDVDGIVEIGGRFLMLEWKPGSGKLSTGQRILYERITKHMPCVVLVVAGDPETMRVGEVAVYMNGTFHEWEPCDLAHLKERMKKWVAWVEKGAPPHV